METYDIAMIVVLVAATLFGAWKGLAWQVASLAAIVASYYVAFHFRDELAQHIHTTPPWNIFIAMLLLYVGTSFVIWVVFRLVSGFIDRLKLKEFDRQIGALFGLAKGVLLCVIITLFAVTLLGEEQRESIIHSRSGYYIAVLLDKADRLLPREVQEVLHPYIHELDSQLQPSAAGNGSASPPAAAPPQDRAAEATGVPPGSGRY
jgi:membrane protein required for colicin V production